MYAFRNIRVGYTEMESGFCWAPLWGAEQLETEGWSSGYQAPMGRSGSHPGINLNRSLKTCEKSQVFIEKCVNQNKIIYVVLSKVTKIHLHLWVQKMFEDQKGWTDNIFMMTRKCCLQNGLIFFFHLTYIWQDDFNFKTNKACFLLKSKIKTKQNRIVLILKNK